MLGYAVLKTVKDHTEIFCEGKRKRKRERSEVD
jgi:hypothetical protein